MKITTLNYLMTPEEASFILKNRNLQNRKLSESRVKAIATEIKEGRFVPSLIVFDTQGNLLDGQHRTAGIALAGISCWIIKGVTDDVNYKYNCDAFGRLRSASDLRQIKDGKDYDKTLMTVANRVTLFYNPSIGQGSANYKNESSKTADRINDIYTSISKEAKTILIAKEHSKASLNKVFTLLAYGICKGKISRDDASTYLNRLSSITHPIETLTLENG